MIGRPVTSDALEALEQERAEADRAYNEALTALDRALPGAPPRPADPPAPPDGRLSELNDLWRTLPPAPPAGRGLRTRLAQFVWRWVAPGFERQQAFNSALVDHLNRTIAHQREAAARAAAATDAAQAYAAAIVTFHSHLILYLQRLTLYIDTKDRRAAGGLMAVYDAAINAVTDEMLKRWESMLAREQRFAARVDAVNQALREQQDVRSTLAVLQQATLTLKRELERAMTAPAPSAPGDDAAAPVPAATAAALESWKYVGFEDRFRGAQDEIRRRMMDYVPLFAGAADVLDIGCGRGEFLDLLREAGVPARGLDLNHEMVEVCRARGLAADEGDALGYLSGLPDASLGGIMAAQVVEHLEPSYLMRLIEVAYHKLRPGGRIVLETINPACWYAFFESYIRDLTHVRPIHPDTLQYLLTASGFPDATIQFRAPYPDREKLQPVVAGQDDPEVVRDMAETLNGNLTRLNALLFSYMDYAATGTRQA
jgi:O-antigen chain-terminating methyltransferase